MSRSFIRVGLGLVAASSIAMLAGCMPPKGESNGRVETTDTTKAEWKSPQVTPTALTEFSDQVAQQLAYDLSSIPELNGATRVNVVFGNIENKTGIVSTSDFEAFRTRIRQQLMQSRNVNNKIKFIANKSQVDSVLERETSRGGDLLQDGSRPERADFNRDYTYFLQGEMYRVARGNDSVNLYMMSFNLTSARDGGIIWTNSPYEVKQVR